MTQDEFSKEMTEGTKQAFSGIARACKALAGMLKEGLEQREEIRKLLARIHGVPAEQFSEDAISAAYRCLEGVKPKYIKIREPDTRKGGDEV